MTSNADVVDDIIGVIQSVISQFTASKNTVTDTTGADPSVEVSVSVRLWRVPGCHELLASLGFDLTDVGQDKVTLRTGKQANRRNIQFVLQALLALFGKLSTAKSIIFSLDIVFAYWSDYRYTRSTKELKHRLLKQFRITRIC